MTKTLRDEFAEIINDHMTAMAVEIIQAAQRSGVVPQNKQDGLEADLSCILFEYEMGNSSLSEMALDFDDCINPILADC